MTVADLVRRLDARKSGNGWMAKCPAHEDHKESLSISEGKGGCILLKCFAGCTLDEILSALRLAKRDLFPDSNSSELSTDSSKKPAPAFPTLLEAISYTARKLKKRFTRRDWYHDGKGNKHFLVVRFDGNDEKDFRPYHRNTSGWVISDPPGKLPLFRLPELLQPAFSSADPLDEFVFVVEGEKCVCALEEKLELLATTSAHGSQSPHKTDWTALAGRNVVILPDNDAGGGGYAQTVAQILLKLSPQAKVRVVALPELPPKGDCVDWLDARVAQTAQEIKAELLELIKNAEVISQVELPPPQGEKTNAEDETIRRLAEMSLLEYEKARLAEAKKLDCRPAILDRLVNAQRVLMRPPSETDNLQGTAVKLADVEPWSEPVNAEILDAIAQRFQHYVVMPQGAADMLALWCAHTHIFKVFQISPRVNVSSPTQECGKTTLRDCASLFCARSVPTDNMTTAVMFRLVSGHSPTILADECDKWLFLSEELVGLICSGHRKSGHVMRCEGDSNELRRFGCYAPVLLAAIGALPDQLHSRSIPVRLERAKKEESKACTPYDAEHVGYENELCRKLARWIADNRERIAACKPQLPENIFNRIADNWRPLFAIAKIAGGNWPQRCANALIKLTTREDETDSLRVMLLADIQQVFTAERMFSKDLVDKLAGMKERPWPEICRGKPITPRWLARNLTAFGIRSRNISIGVEQAKGYERSDFDEAFARYLPDTGNLSVHPSTTEVKTPNSIRPQNDSWTDKKTGFHEAYGRMDGSKGGKPGKGDKVI